MKRAYDVAKYLAERYMSLYGEQISEMKLHKLLYLAQRESIIKYDRLLFSDEFQGWRFGPVLPGIRHAYQEIVNWRRPMEKLDVSEIDTLEEVLRRYGNKDPWSLSRLTHGEYSWQQSRLGLKEYENGYNQILARDIRIDAQRVKERRRMIGDL